LHRQQLITVAARVAYIGMYSLAQVLAIELPWYSPISFVKRFVEDKFIVTKNVGTSLFFIFLNENLHFVSCAVKSTFNVFYFFLF